MSLETWSQTHHWFGAFGEIFPALQTMFFFCAPPPPRDMLNRKSNLSKRRRKRELSDTGMIKTPVEPLRPNQSSHSNSERSLPRLDDEFIYHGTASVSANKTQGIVFSVTKER